MSTIEVIINGATRTVTKLELFDLAARGIIGPDTVIMVNGKLATTGKVKGIVFGQPQNTGRVPVPPVPPVTALPTSTGVTMSPQSQQIVTPALSREQPQPKENIEKIQARRSVLGRLLGGSGSVLAVLCMVIMREWKKGQDKEREDKKQRTEQRTELLGQLKERLKELPKEQREQLKEQLEQLIGQPEWIQIMRLKELLKE